MKCFWSPYICVLASAALADPSVWSAIVAKVSGGPNRRVMNFTRHLILLFVILLLASHQKPIIDTEMEDLREFYDPDTVDLMQWIQQNSQPDNAFYVILEDSICLAHRERCSTPDIMDLTNGHIPDDGIKQPVDLVESPHPRFCDEVRYDTE